MIVKIHRQPLKFFFLQNCYKAKVDLIYAVLGLIFYTIFLRMYVSSTEDKITYGFGVIT